MQIPRPRTADLKPTTTITALAGHPILDVLSGPQLVAYLRLIAATEKQRRRTVNITNGELYRDARTAVRVVRELAEMGLVKVMYEHGRFGRTIEVRR